MTTSCTACARPVKDQAYLCQGCTDRLARDLGDVGALARELQTTRLKQDRVTGAATGVLSRSADKPLPWNQHAAEIDDALRATVVGWVRVVVEERGGRPPENTMQALSGFLLASVEWLRHHADAAECADEISDSVGRARQAVDRPASRTYFGPCGSVDYDDNGPVAGCEPCRADLYGAADDTALVCKVCSTPHDVADVRLYLVAQAQDRLVTAADLSKFLSAYGEPLTAERVRQWATRGQLVAHGHDPSGRPMYRVSEAADLLASLATRRPKQGDTPKEAECA